MTPGNYRKPKPKPVSSAERDVDIRAGAPAAAAPSPGATLATAVEKNLEREVSETEEGAERALTFEERLKAANVTLAEAREIRDALLIDGFYSEQIRLSQNTAVVFRTRNYRDFVRFHQAVDRYQPKFVDERNEIALRYFLAGSLVSYRDEIFDHPESRDIKVLEEAFDKRHARVLDFPEPVMRLLAQKLHEFDAKVQLCLSEGSVEDF